MLINLRSSLLLIAMVQGLVIACLLAIRGYRKNRIQDFFLAGLLFFLVCSLIEHFIGFMGVYDTMREAGHDLTYFPFSNGFMYGPFIYLYVQALTDGQFRWEKQYWWHYLLPMLFYCLRLGVWLLPIDQKAALFQHYQFWLHAAPELLLYITSFWYIVRSLRRFQSYRHLIEQEYSNTGDMTLRWLKIFLVSFTGYLVFDFCFNVVGAIWNFWYTGYFWLNLIRAILLYYISVAGWAFAQKSLLDFNTVNARESTLSGQNEYLANAEATLGNGTEPTGKTLFSPEELHTRSIQLQAFMQKEQAWLDPELTLSALATRFGLNTSQLSYLVNKAFGKNFNDFINEYRVAAVKEKMKMPECQHLSLLGIAFESGFNSKATFNRAFKKLTGLAPSEFAKVL